MVAGVQTALAVANDEENTEKLDNVVTTAIVGGAILAVSIPIKISAKSHLKRSVRLFNENVGFQKVHDSASCKFVLNTNGVGLCLKF